MSDKVQNWLYTSFFLSGLSVGMALTLLLFRLAEYL